MKLNKNIFYVSIKSLESACNKITKVIAVCITSKQFMIILHKVIITVV